MLHDRVQRRFGFEAGKTFACSEMYLGPGNRREVLQLGSRCQEAGAGVCCSGRFHGLDWHMVGGYAGENESVQFGESAD